MAPPRPGGGPAAGTLAAGRPFLPAPGGAAHSASGGDPGGADPGAGFLADGGDYAPAAGDRPGDRDRRRGGAGAAVRSVPQAGGCGDAADPCAPVGPPGLLGGAGSGLVRLQRTALHLHRGNGHRPHGGHQPEPRGARRGPAAAGDGAASTAFPAGRPCAM